MSKTEHRLPENLNPDGDICVPVFIPNDAQWISAFHGAVRILTHDRYWERDEVDGEDTIAVRNRWKESTYFPLIDALMNGSGCDSSTDGNCITLKTSSETFLFEPNNPFDGTDQRYTSIAARWRRYSDLNNFEQVPEWIQSAIDILGDNIGYFPNDIFVSYTDEGLFQDTAYDNFFDYASSFNLFPFPVVKWKMQGYGQFEIEFVQTPLGGSVLLMWDIDPAIDLIFDILTGNAASEADNWRLFEINRDILSIPPELLVSFIQEIEFEEDTDHTVQAIFSPRVNDEIPFYFPFGGIREIEVCGNLRMIGWNTGEIITEQNYGLSQHNQTGVIELSTSDDFYDALVRYETEKANRWLLGYDTDNIVSDVTVDKDTGKVSSVLNIARQPTIGDASNNEVNYGYAYGVGSAFLEIIGNEMLEWYDDGAGVAISVITARLRQFYKFLPFVDGDPDPLETALDAALPAATDTVSPVVNPDVVARFVFCYGATKDALYRYALSIEEGGSTDALDIANLYRAVIDNLDDDQIVAWYLAGIDPRLGFDAAPCYRFPVSELTITPSNFTGATFAWITNGMANRKLRAEIQVIEPFVNSGGDVFDGVWRKNSGGSPANTWAMRIYNPPAGTASTSIPAYLAGTGKYVMEYNCSLTITGTWFNNISFTPLSGEIRVKVYDLGSLA